ncbi:transient receptor potential cation channel subfamily M member 2-like [Paramacrobiotus metropolitanus]|uniref:transient receptor potential cation channel subfamily M member 2-like n=1 Tax=Paramacrobiotus metropolitanus TaxID=2943436 RepID=UPI002445D6A9|nr:transient receptor potential cation channel subfamily M member 2-like [Paramacrobiotus metropolitanus]
MRKTHSSNIFHAASQRGAQKTIAPVKSLSTETVVLTPRNSPARLKATVPQAKPQPSEYGDLKPRDSLQYNRRLSAIVESENQIAALAKAVSAQWGADRMPDLICSLLTGSAGHRKVFRTVSQRNAFQAGMGGLILHLPGSIFVYDHSIPSEPATLLENMLLGVSEYEEHVGFAVDKQWLDIPHENSVIRLQQPVRKKAKIGPYVGAYYDKIVILRAPNAAESSRLRSELELAIWMELFYQYSYRPEKRESNIRGSPVASVVILIQGSVDELPALLTYIDNNVAIVIVAGTGGMADLLAEGITLRKKVSGDVLTHDLEAYAKQLLPALSKPSIQSLVETVIKVLERKTIDDWAVVLDATDSQNLANLEEYVVRAIVRGSYGFAEEYIFHANLSLALKCRQLEVTKAMMFHDPTWNAFQVPWHIFELAVGIRNRSQFVDVFIQDGFSLKHHLTPVKLARLFQYTFDDPTGFFWKHVWKEILGFRDDDLLDDRFVTLHLNPLIDRLTGISHFVDLGEISTFAYGFTSGATEFNIDRKAMNALMIFAVLADDFDLVLVTIKHSLDPIPTTLFAESMYRGLARCMPDYSVRQMLRARADRLGEVAHAMYDMAYSDNRYRARALLIRDLPDYNNHNVLRLALDARDKKFLSHRWIQEFLSRWYYGFISVEGRFDTAKLLLSALFVLPIYKWLSFPALERTQYYKRRKTLRSGSRIGLDFIDTNSRFHERPITDEEKQAYIGTLATSLRDKEILGNQRRTSRPKKFSVPLVKRIYAVWNSPCIKFYTSQWIYYTFLIVMYVAMMLPPCRYIGVDIAVCVYVVLRWIAVIMKGSYMHQNKFVYEPWKTKLSVFFEGVFCILFFLFRIAPFRYDYPWAGRVILGFGVFYYSYRVWDMFYTMDGIIGPTIRLVVRSFTIDVTKWVAVTYPMFMATGLVWQTVVYPDAPATGSEWRRALFRAFGAIFGFADYPSLEYTGACASSKIDWTNVNQPMKNMSNAYPKDRCWIGDYSDPGCNTVTFWSYGFYLHYYIFVLIGSQFVLSCAIYTRFIDEWVDNSLVWKYYRTKLIMQYGVLSSLPPPLNILGYLGTVIKYCISKGRKSGSGLKNMIEMEKLERADSSFGGPLSPYWSSVALRYFGNEDDKKNAVLQKEKDDQACHNVEVGLTYLLEFIEDKQRLLSSL